MADRGTFAILWPRDWPSWS